MEGGSFAEFAFKLIVQLQLSLGFFAPVRLLLVAAFAALRKSSLNALPPMAESAKLVVAGYWWRPLIMIMMISKLLGNCN